MAEKSIIFNTQEVQAIMENKKTMTRRMIVSQPPQYADKAEVIARYGGWSKYRVGDILWVKETHAKAQDGGYIYRADSIFDGCGPGDFAWKWKSSIHMPREAARIFLKVTDVRAERLQDISNIQAKYEGAEPLSALCQMPKYERACMLNCKNCNRDIYRESFQYLWDTLNAKRGYSWESNPWVWVISFERTEEEV
jgi:hypothetical protein